MRDKATTPENKEIVFFIDKQQFKTEPMEITASDLLSHYAAEDPAETTLVLQHGKELTKYDDSSQLITIQNGMHFVVYHNGPTTVSGYGPRQLAAELEAMGFKPELVADAQNNSFIILHNYTVQLGKFAGKVIDLGIPAPGNYPQAVGASIHVRSEPQLYEKGNIPNVRNVIDSSLGPKWHYWSRNFNWHAQRKKDARRLMSQIAGVFKDA